MTGRKKTISGMDMAVGLLILAAFLCRVSMLYDCPFYVELGFLRSAIHIAIPVGWCFSVSRRVVQPQARRQIMMAAMLMVFWTVVRTIKYNFVEDPLVTHWLWYLFYVPYILIPTLSIFVSEAICKPETHRTPKRMLFLFVPALVLLALVLTNDLHQLVFTFPAGGPKYPTDGYGYGTAYYCVVAWVFFCAVLTFVVIFRKSRIPGAKKRILIPLSLLFLLIVYSVLYALYVPFIKVWLNDMSAVFCLLLMAMFESFFRLNLIHTNTHYNELFRRSSTPACIVDTEYRELSRSEDYLEIPIHDMQRAETAPVILQDKIRISTAPIKQGHVLWEEDITELLEQIRDLEDIQERLEDSNVVAAEEYRTRLRQRQLIERNRMYDKMQAQTERQVLELRSLVDRLAGGPDAAEEKRLLLKLGVLGAYIKRRNNLIFLAENQDRLAASELMYCIRESLQNLPVFDVSADQYFALDGDLPFDGIVLLYDAFEQTLEAALGAMTAIFVSVTAEEDRAVLTVRLCADTELTTLKECGLQTVREEPGEWIITVSTPRHGGAER
ncbi:MAG: hypothetical protein HUJ67_04995 [Ruminiclostridium sp.]|nr:hypothetical protein [Ruminiclostridium sp.]